MNQNSALTLLFATVLAPLASAQEPLAAAIRSETDRARAAFDCRVLGPRDVLAELDAAVAAGSISIQPPPTIAPGPAPGGVAAVTGGCLTREHIFPYEDTNQLLLTNFSIGELLDFMTDAANSLMLTHGDRYDFVAVPRQRRRFHRWNSGQGSSRTHRHPTDHRRQRRGYGHHSGGPRSQG